MKTSKIAIWTLLPLAAGATALSGCGKRSAANPTAINYSQVGVCKSWPTSGTEYQKARADEIFAVFKIDSVDNSKPSSEFGFDPERLFVDQSTAAQKTKNLSFQVRRFIVSDPRFALAMRVSRPERATVPANQKLDVNGFFIVPVSTNLPEDKPPVGNAYDLIYDTTNPIEQWQQGAGDIIMAKANPQGATFTPVEDCRELAYK